MARPVSPKYELEFMLKRIDEYTDNTVIPILKELCYQQYWDYDYIIKIKTEKEELGRSIKRLLNKKEAQLEKLALMGKVSRTMAIFSLKQLGWKDKSDDEDENSEILNNVKIEFVNASGEKK